MSAPGSSQEKNNVFRMLERMVCRFAVIRGDHLAQIYRRLDLEPVDDEILAATALVPFETAIVSICVSMMEASENREDIRREEVDAAARSVRPRVDGADADPDPDALARPASSGAAGSNPDAPARPASPGAAESDDSDPDFGAA